MSNGDEVRVQGDGGEEEVLAQAIDKKVLLINQSCDKRFRRQGISFPALRHKR